MGLSTDREPDGLHLSPGLCTAWHCDLVQVLQLLHTDLSPPPSWGSWAAARPVPALWLIVSLGMKGGPGQRLPIVSWGVCVFIESEMTSVQSFPGSLEAWRCTRCPDGMLMEAI